MYRVYIKPASNRHQTDIRHVSDIYQAGIKQTSNRHQTDKCRTNKKLVAEAVLSFHYVVSGAPSENVDPRQLSTRGPQTTGYTWATDNWVHVGHRQLGTPGPHTTGSPLLWHSLRQSAGAKHAQDERESRTFPICAAISGTRTFPITAISSARALGNSVD
ncbi:hypothetical protein BgiBS90_002950 [Biomphalaria glabrata]|nr:hypothetical protein BgiBS90_002950 [Biomphalaria glabrata]